MTNPDSQARAHFAANVEDLRRRRGLSVDALAARAEVESPALAEILSGESEADTEAIYRLAGALDVDPGELFSGVSWSPPADGGEGYDFDGP